MEGFVSLWRYNDALGTAGVALAQSHRVQLLEAGTDLELLLK